MQDNKKLHICKVEINYWAEFDFAYNHIYREAVTIIPNSEFSIKFALPLGDFNLS